ncbi:fasciclin domain-containing protein [Aureibacter tunicatorum]|uniref:FAS1 domain-containing protein n=1 Tax=Aureibacter tunicatorum TaxID=866807 RepID=A0AAE3XPK6_9BACT|nr:fasciclin domain-containing protein [Aureibacter tunicatorum]MDR6240797.1 hypothetical protein [Aureibacter tunicatorum]BDD06870.1 hypothetical protein AUTU_43530 [Aureibacter tunicatorum]
MKHLFKTLSYTAILSMLLAFFSSCSNDDSSSAPNTVSQQVLSNYGNSEFAKLYKKSKFYDELNKEIDYKVDLFIPTNAALESEFSTEELNSLGQKELDRLIGLHIVKVDYNQSKFTKKLYDTEATNNDGQSIKAHISYNYGNLYINGVKAVEKKNEKYCAIYQIDGFPDPRDIVRILAADEDYSKFYSLLKKVADNESRLKSLIYNKENDFTIFPVDNDGVNTYLKDNNYTNVEDIPLEKAEKIIGRHVAKIRVEANPDKAIIFTNFNGEKSKVEIKNGQARVYYQLEDNNSSKENSQSEVNLSELEKLGLKGGTSILTKLFTSGLSDLFDAF